MSLASQYPVTAFSETQTFLVWNPSTQTLNRVQGSDLVNYITPGLGRVYGESTRAAALNGDYAIGNFIQTAGGSAIGDGGNGMYLVVEGGTGDYSMLNGNDLLLLPFGSLAGSDIDGALITDETSTPIEEAVEKRAVRFANLEAFRASSCSYPEVIVEAANAGTTTGRMILKATGTSAGTPTLTGARFTALAAGEIINAGGYGYALSKDQLVTSYMFGTTGVNTAGADTDGLTAYFAWLNADRSNEGIIGQGVFNFDATISLSVGERSIKGALNPDRRTGSSRNQCTLVWSGGALPMFSTNTTRHVFSNFAVEGNGTGTYFLEMNSGSQAPEFDHVYFNTSSFASGVIKSNGNRIGYARFKFVNDNNAAPRFIDLDGQSTAGGCTPIAFADCQFSNSGSGGTTPRTIVYVKDEIIEAVTFERCTLISNGGLVVVDTTDTPASETIRNLSIKHCEIDNVQGASFRMFKCENVTNISFDDNNVTGENAPVPEALFELVNSKVSSAKGNWITRIDYLFNADATSIVRGIGYNDLDWSTCEGITNGATASYTALTQATTVLLDGADWGPAEIGQYVLDITAAGAYTLQLDLSKPQNFEPGQIFTVTIRNTSGGAISNPAWGSNFHVQAAAMTAPATGFQISVMFRFNGTHAQQISGPTPDIAN